MAYFDRALLINAIRYAWLAADDTGVVEALCDPVEPMRKPGGPLPTSNDGIVMHWGLGNGDEEDYLRQTQLGSSSSTNLIDASTLGSGSPDIPCELGTGRMRSNTAIQLERLREQKAQVVKRIPWHDPPETVNDSLFEERPIQKPSENDRPRKSKVTALLSEIPSDIENPFQDFSKVLTRKTSVAAKTFLVIYATSRRDTSAPAGTLFSTKVSAMASSKVSELIGACCFQYVIENSGKELPSTNPSMYELYLAEESGEIEMDLPPLNKNEQIGRLGFPAVALVYVGSPEDEMKSSRRNTQSGNAQQVHVYFTSGEHFTIELDRRDLTLGWVRDQALMRRKEKRESSMDAKQREEQEKLLRLDNTYRIETLREPATVINPDQTADSATTNEFLVIRENCGRGPFRPPGRWRTRTTQSFEWASGASFEQLSMAEGSILYDDDNADVRRHAVDIVNRRFHTKTPANFAMTHDLLEILPIMDPNATLQSVRSRWSLSFAPPKRFAIRVDNVGGIEVVEERLEETLLRFWYTTSTGAVGEWRKFYIEVHNPNPINTENRAAYALCEDVNSILDALRTELRCEYGRHPPSLMKRRASTLGLVRKFSTLRRGTDTSAATTIEEQPDLERQHEQHKTSIDIKSLYTAVHHHDNDVNSMAVVVNVVEPTTNKRKTSANEK